MHEDAEGFATRVGTEVIDRGPRRAIDALAHDPFAIAAHDIDIAGRVCSDGLRPVKKVAHPAADSIPFGATHRPKFSADFPLTYWKSSKVAQPWAKVEYVENTHASASGRKRVPRSRLRFKLSNPNRWQAGRTLNASRSGRPHHERASVWSAWSLLPLSEGRIMSRSDFIFIVLICVRCLFSFVHSPLLLRWRKWPGPDNTPRLKGNGPFFVGECAG
jgi:hypothetical protein